jgi:hypothetical protein
MRLAKGGLRQLRAPPGAAPTGDDRQPSPGASFHCHKGVLPGGEHGFAYPHDADGKPKKRKLRLYRDYLNALGKWWGAAEPDQSRNPKGASA